MVLGGRFSSPSSLVEGPPCSRQQLAHRARLPTLSSLLPRSGGLDPLSLRTSRHLGPIGLSLGPPLRRHDLRPHLDLALGRLPLARDRTLAAPRLFRGPLRCLAGLPSPQSFHVHGEPGTTLEAFPTPVGTIATPVCFDCDYSAVPRQLVRNGAEIIFAPSMDAMRWTERQHEQHAQLFRHRAAENGRWIAVAATSGVTQIIAPNGQVASRLIGMEPGSLIGQVGRETRLTFYTRFGWLLGPLCSVATVGLLILSLLMWFSEKHRRSGRPYSD